jgi:hypothetical protein
MARDQQELQEVEMTIEDGPDDTLSVSESLDSDEVKNNDGDDVVDPPDTWKVSDKFGATTRERREGEPLDERLAAEESDPVADLARESEGSMPPESVVEDLDGRDPLDDDTDGNAGRDKDM